MPEYYSERGFAQYARDIPTGYGDTVSVYESSSAEGSYVWLKIEGEAFLTGQPFTLRTGERKAMGWNAAHCDLEAAKHVHRALGAWIAREERDNPDDPMAEMRAVIYDRSDRGREALRARVEAAEGVLRGALGWTMRFDLATSPPTYWWTPPREEP